MRLADAYRCGHCRSEVSTGYDVVTGTDKVRVSHDHYRPVLTGTLSDVPDMLRAADAVGGLVIADAATGRVVATLYPQDNTA